MCRGGDLAELHGPKMEFAPLFTNEERAGKFTELCIFGDYDEDLLKSIFQNCVNLDKLGVRFCPQLSDYHLIELADRGARLSKLSLIIATTSRTRERYTTFSQQRR